MSDDWKKRSGAAASAQRRPAAQKRSLDGQGISFQAVDATEDHLLNAESWARGQARERRSSPRRVDHRPSNPFARSDLSAQEMCVICCEVAGPRIAFSSRRAATPRRRAVPHSVARPALLVDPRPLSSGRAKRFRGMWSSHEGSTQAGMIGLVAGAVFVYLCPPTSPVMSTAMLRCPSIAWWSRSSWPTGGGASRTLFRWSGPTAARLGTWPTMTRRRHMGAGSAGTGSRPSFPSMQHAQADSSGASGGKASYCTYIARLAPVRANQCRSD